MAGVAALAWPLGAEASRVVYLNFDQTQLTDANGQDPTTNSFSSNGFTPGTITGWPGLTDEQKAELVYLMKEASVDFDITYTLERPVTGTYDMVVFGTDTDAAALFSGLGCSPAIGLADCDDGNAENIAFMFYGCLPAAQQSDMRRVAFNAFVALGFGWGLENLDVSGQIMGSYTLTALQFGNTCVPIDGAAGCSHVGCTSGQQNSTQDLLSRIGARVDDGPPVVTITSPANGTVVDPDITVQAEVSDAFGGLQVTLEVVEPGQMLADSEPPYAWDLSNVPQGMWTLRVTAIDADGNSTSDEVGVCVGLDECVAEPGTTGDEAGDSSGSADDEGESTGDGSTSTGSGEETGNTPIDPTGNPTGGFGPPSSASGCHCTADPRHPNGWSGGLLLLAALGLRRRRLTPAG